MTGHFIGQSNEIQFQHMILLGKPHSPKLAPLFIFIKAF